MFSRKFFLKNFLIICTSKYWGFFALIEFKRFDHLLKIYKNSLDNMICLVYWPIFCSIISSHFQTGKGFWQHFCNYPWCLFLQYSPLRTYCISVSQGRLDLFYKVFFSSKITLYLQLSPLTFFFHFLWNFVLLFQLKNERKIAVRKYFYSHLG